MKVRNDTDTDRFIYGVHLAVGATVDISNLHPAKQESLCLEFTRVDDAPPVKSATPNPAPFVYTKPDPPEAGEATATPPPPVHSGADEEKREAPRRYRRSVPKARKS